MKSNVASKMLPVDPSTSSGGPTTFWAGGLEVAVLEAEGGEGGESDAVEDGPDQEGWGDGLSGGEGGVESV